MTTDSSEKFPCEDSPGRAGLEPALDGQEWLDRIDYGWGEDVGRSGVAVTDNNEYNKTSRGDIIAFTSQPYRQILWFDQNLEKT